MDLLKKLIPSGTTCWGLDLGTHSLKVIKISRSRNTLKIHDFEQIPLSVGTFLEGEINNFEQLAQDISSLKNLLPQKGGKICLGLFGNGTCVKKMQVAGKNEQEREDQVYWEIEQYLSFPIEEGEMSLFPYGKNSGGTHDILAAVCTQSLLEVAKELLDRCGHKLSIVDLVPVALGNFFEFFLDKQQLYSPDKTFLLLDMGGQVSTLIALKNRQLVFSKEIFIGANLVTEEIQRKLGVSFKEAEDLKNQALLENPPEEIAEILEESSVLLAKDYKKLFEIYQSQASESLPEMVYVTGGGVLNHYFLSHFQTETGIACEVLSVSSCVEVNSSIEETYGNFFDIFSPVAIGLALRASHD